MTRAQIESIVRSLLIAIGSSVAGWAAAKGWVSADTVMAVLNSETVVGLVVSAACLVWGVVTKTPVALISQVADLSSVRAVLATSAMADTGPLKDNPKVVSSIKK